MRAVAGFSTPVPTMGAGAGVCRCPAAAAAAKPASLAALQQCNRARLNCRSLSDAAAPIQGSSFATTSTRRRVVTAAAAAGVTSAGGGAVAPPALDAAERPRARLAVFVSGGGSNMRAIHAACQSGQINADVAVRSRTAGQLGAAKPYVCVWREGGGGKGGEGGLLRFATPTAPHPPLQRSSTHPRITRPTTRPYAAHLSPVTGGCQ